MKTVLMPIEFGARRQNTPKLIIVHAMGEFIEDRANNNETYFAVDWLRHLRISAHVLVTPSGVPIRCRANMVGAYHAKGNNTDSLGIEFLVPGLHNYDTFLDTIRQDYISQQQYQTGVEIIADWVRRYEINNVVRHSDIDPTRKVDPGSGFPWHKFLNSINAIL